VPPFKEKAETGKYRLVVECLPSMHKALDSNPSTTKQGRREGEREGRKRPAEERSSH
jgi:hypothetical protein